MAGRHDVLARQLTSLALHEFLSSEASLKADEQEKCVRMIMRVRVLVRSRWSIQASKFKDRLEKSLLDLCYGNFTEGTFMTLRISVRLLTRAAMFIAHSHISSSHNILCPV